MGGESANGPDQPPPIPTEPDCAAGPGVKVTVIRQLGSRSVRGSTVIAFRGAILGSEKALLAVVRRTLGRCGSFQSDYSFSAGRMNSNTSGGADRPPQGQGARRRVLALIRKRANARD